MRFANYVNNTYLFNYDHEDKQYEIVTKIMDKTNSLFEKYKNCYFQTIDLYNPDMTDVFDIQLWLKYDTGIEGLPLVWDVSLDGFTVIKEGTISIDYHGPVGDTTNWKRIDKSIWQTFIKLSDISGAYVLYTYKKKDGVIYDEPVIVREDVSVERMIELRNYYGGKL